MNLAHLPPQPIIPSRQDVREPNPPGKARFGTPDVAELWLLVGRADPDASALEVPIISPRFTLGRLPDNDLCLRNPTVSSRHATLFLVGSEVHLADLQSTNGTFVNGRRVRGPTILQTGDILQFGTAVFELQRLGRAPTNATLTFDVATDAIALLEFDRLMHEPALIPHYQPIIRLVSNEKVGYEVVARSRLAHLETPAQMFRIAASRNAEFELSRLARWLGVQAGHRRGLPLYINTHPSEVGEACLLDSLDQLRNAFPDVPLCLEIHEAAITSTKRLADLRSRLKELQISLAYDDFGAGQARLLEIVEVPPDVIKFDICLVRGLPAASADRRRLVQSLVDIVRQFGVTTLAEGVETEEEAAICREMGFDLAQGFLFGRPAPLEASCPPTTKRE